MCGVSIFCLLELCANQTPRADYIVVPSYNENDYKRSACVREGFSAAYSASVFESHFWKVSENRAE